MSSLGEELPNEMQRVTGLLQVYSSLPNGAGNFAAVIMRQTLDRATRALASGDVIQMIRVYEELKGFKE